MRAPEQRSLVLILARDFASRLASAVFLVDLEGNLIYFNEAAERILGRPFVEGVPMDAGEWATAFRPVDEDGAPVALEGLPLARAIRELVASHRALRIVGADGVARRIGVTAFPLFAHEDDPVGGIAFFWEQPEGG